MTDVKQEVPLTEEQKYLQGILGKFNENQEDPTLSLAERKLLGKVVFVEKEVNDLAQEFVKLNNEVKEKQEQMNALNQQILLKKGQSQGLVESLLTLRSDEEGIG
jgi:hypothetical protein